MKNLLRLYILYRLEIIAVLMVAGIISNIFWSTPFAIFCYLLSAISITLYFMLGTMRLVQEAVTDGDMDNAVFYLSKIKYPQLLFKPVRAGYYMLQSNLSMVSNDLDKAEASIRKSLEIKSEIIGDMQGTNLMQLGFIELKKGNNKQARIHLLDAIKAGVPDVDNLAAIYLQLSSLEAQRTQYKAAKQYFKKAKDLKPKNAEIVSQIRTLEKQMRQLPG